MVEFRIWQHEDCYEESDDDSVMTGQTPAIGEIMKAAGRLWAQASKEVKDAWRERANRINDLPLYNGTFESVPHELVEPSVQTNLIQSLTLEWQYIASLVRNSILSNRRRCIQTSQMTYKFGRESIILHSQSYRSHFMSHLLQLTIFGNPKFLYLFPYEIPYRSRKQAIVHLFSQRRISDLFTYGGLNASEVKRDGMKYVICCKVNLKHGRKNIIGYAVDKDDDSLDIKIEGRDETIRIRRPGYDNINGKYLCRRDVLDRNGTYSLSQVWPIRIKINKSGHIAYIISVNSTDDVDEQT